MKKRTIAFGAVAAIVVASSRLPPHEDSPFVPGTYHAGHQQYDLAKPLLPDTDKKYISQIVEEEKVDHGYSTSLSDYRFIPTKIPKNIVTFSQYNKIGEGKVSPPYSAIEVYNLKLKEITHYIGTICRSVHPEITYVFSDNNLLAFYDRKGVLGGGFPDGIAETVTIVKKDGGTPLHKHAQQLLEKLSSNHNKSPLEIGDISLCTGLF